MTRSTVPIDDGAAGTEGALPVSASLAVAEIKVDPPGTDGNYEFVELAGDPSSQLAGYWLLALEGDSDANPGQIDVAIDLSQCATGPCQLDAQGLLVLVADPEAINPKVGSAWYSAKELVNGKLENGTTTLIAVAGLSPSEIGADWDVDDDGVLELPPHVTVRHAVAWTDGGSGDRAYSTEIAGPKPKAQAAWRCSGPNEAITWRWGELQGDAASLAMNVTRTAPEGLEHASLTPGSYNDCSASTSLVSETRAPSRVAAAGTPPFDDTPTVAGSGGAESQVLATCPPAGAESSRAPAGSGGDSAVSPAPLTGTISPGQTLARDSLRPNESAPIPVAGCGGANGQARVVALPVPQAGSNGWWSPNPFAVPVGGRAHSTVSAQTTSATPETDSAPPHLPGSCAARPSPHRLSNPFLLAATCLALLRLWGPRRAVR